MEATKSEPKVIIIILTWNDYKSTIKCIKSFLKISYTNYEIIVVDNGSNDNTENKIKNEYPNMTVLQTGENLGFSGGNNYGIKYAVKLNPKYILVSNNDVTVDPNFLTYLVKDMEKDTNIGAANPAIYYADNKRKIWFIDGPINWYKGTTIHKYQKQLDKNQINGIHDTDRLTGCEFFIRADLLKAMDLLKSDYFIYWEDTELSVRIKKAGYRLVVIPKSKVYHNESSSHKGKDSPKIIYYYTRNKLFFMKEYGSKIQFTTSFLYEIYYVFRRFLSHIVKRKLTLGTIKASFFAFYDFFMNKTGRVQHAL